MEIGPRTGAVAGPQQSAETAALALLQRMLPGPPAGEVWAGDDAAVLKVPVASGGSRERLMVLATDVLVAGVDADLSLTTLADFGWKALAVNLSDIAAMGCEPGHAVVSVIGASVAELTELYSGILDASGRYGCPVVGGDLSDGPALVVSVAVTGWAMDKPVLRTGASPGDSVWVTAPVGAAAAGLRLARSGDAPPELVLAHARPRPALAEGLAALHCGATAMIDVSDGLAIDLSRVAHSSGVGIDLTRLPVAAGATEQEALHGGDDYVLAFTLPAGVDASQHFKTDGLPSPCLIGACTAQPGQMTLRGQPLTAAGWEHKMGTM